jgi:diamine N-acetyltransferase
MNLTFKKTGPADIEVISQLAERIWKAHYINIITQEQIDYMLNKMYSAKKLLEQMESGQEFTLAYLNEIPVGYISVSQTTTQNYFLHKFYVETSEQAKGIGTAFFHFVEKSLNAPESIELTVNRKNYKAINFYFKNGFIIKDVADFDIGNGFFMNDFIMIKKYK